MKTATVGWSALGGPGRKPDPGWKEAENTRVFRPRASCSVCELHPCVLLPGDLSKEVNCSNNSIEANREEVPVLIHRSFCLIIFLIG